MFFSSRTVYTSVFVLFFFFFPLELPFQASLQCIASFDSSDLDGVANSGRGDVAILAFNDNGITRYYCAVSLQHADTVVLQLVVTLAVEGEVAVVAADEGFTCSVGS